MKRVLTVLVVATLSVLPACGIPVDSSAKIFSDPGVAPRCTGNLSVDVFFVYSPTSTETRPLPVSQSQLRPVAEPYGPTKAYATNCAVESLNEGPPTGGQASGNFSTAFGAVPAKLSIVSTGTTAVVALDPSFLFIPLLSQALAFGQIVLTLTYKKNALGITSVLFEFAGRPYPNVRLPSSELQKTGEPVTFDDYCVDLLHTYGGCLSTAP